MIAILNHENKIETEQSKKIIEQLEFVERLETNKDIYILEEAVGAIPSRLAELYDRSQNRVRAILGAMLFAVTVQVSAGQENKSVESVERSVPVKTQEQREQIKEITGIDIVAEAEKVGRQVGLYLPKEKSATTILFLGQVHAIVGNPESNFYSKINILKSQNEIASILNVISNTNTQKLKVFTEGYAEEHRKIFTFFHSINNHLKNDTMSFDDLINEYNQIDISGAKDERLNVIVNKIFGDKLISMGFRESSPLFFENGVVGMKLRPTGLLLDEKSSTENSNIESLVIGTTEFLDTEGVVELEPSETVEVSGKTSGLNIYEKLKRINEIFPNTFIGNYQQDLDGTLKSLIKNKGLLQNSITNNAKDMFNLGFRSSDFIKKLAESHDCKVNKECSQLTEEIIKKDILELKEAIFDKREDVVIELIAKNGTGQKLVPVVYGTAHDFTRAVKKWNDKHPEQQFNLVTVKSQKWF